MAEESTMITEIGGRLKQYLTYQKLTQAEAATRMGVDDKFLSNIQAGRNFSSGAITRLSVAFPLLNIDWLLTGIGGMDSEDRDRNHERELAPLVQRSEDLAKVEGLISDARKVTRIREVVEHMHKLNLHRLLTIAKLTDILLEVISIQNQKS